MSPHDRNGGEPAWCDRMKAVDELLAAVRTRGPHAVASHPAAARLGGLDGALRYLHGRWVTLLGAAIDEVLEAGDRPVLDSVWTAWEGLGAARPELAVVLAHHAHHSAVRRADASHRRLLASVSRLPAARLPGFSTAHTHDTGPGCPRPAGAGMRGVAALITEGPGG